MSFQSRGVNVIVSNLTSFLFLLFFSYQSVPQQKCQTTYENKCSTTYETTYEYVSKDKCTTEYVQECKPSYGYGGQDCQSVPKQKCYKVCTLALLTKIIHPKVTIVFTLDIWQVPIITK